MPSMSTLMGKRWFGALRSARRLSHLRSRAHFLRFPPMRAPGCGDARALGKDALRCRVPAAVPARVSSAAVPSPDVPHSLPVLLDVSTVRAAVPLQLGDARVAQPSTRRPPPITYEFGRRRWSRASSAPASARRAARCASLAMALRCPTRLLAGAPLVCASILAPGGDLWRSGHLLLELRTRLSGCEAIGGRGERCERCARCPSE